MSGASDKARFFLEQSVPELKELERKRIFTLDEITAITRKRSDFEHKINARGSSPSDYARYAEFEINVDALRRMRVKRLAIKAPTFAGRRRIFFVLDRGTRKFPGDLGLWMQSIEFARKQKAYKKLSQTLTNVLRLNPTKAELWIYAAQCVLEENADMTEARSYMQRGLRFCQNSRHLWLEYARLELTYITKIIGRRQILGIIGQTPTAQTEINDGLNADILRLPTFPSEGNNLDSPDHDTVDEAALQELEATPVLTGAIPIAIFDAATRHFKNDPAFALEFFDLGLEYSGIPCQRKFLEHIDRAMSSPQQSSWQAAACHIRQPLAGIQPNVPEFAGALGISLRRLKEFLAHATDQEKLARHVQHFFEQYLEARSLNPSVEKVLRSMLTTLGRVE